MFAAQLGVEDDPPAGVEGLVALTQALRTHRAERDARELDETDDGRPDAPQDSEHRSFVELAGAYLAVVLRQSLAQGEHVRHARGHGLHLGAHGYFDPFAAIEDALEAEDVRACLVSWVRDAEAEARDRGPYARAAAAVLSELRQRFARVEVLGRAGPELSLSIEGRGVQLDVRRVAALARGRDDAAVAKAALKLLSAIPALQAEARPDFEEARGSLFPRLVAPAFFDGTAQQQGRLLRAPLLPGIELSCVLRQEGRARFVDAQDVERWQTDERALLSTALHNLAGQSERARLLRQDGDGVTLVVARTGDGLDASRLLLPGLHDVLAPELGSPFVAAVPHRDALFACPRDCERSVRALTERAARESVRAPHSISPTPVLVGVRGRLQPLA